MVKIPNFGLKDQLIPVERAQRVGRLVALWAAVGVVAGSAAILFTLLVETAQSVLLEGWAGYHPALPALGQGHPWILALLPVLGGLVGGFLVCWLAPEAGGAGTGAAIDAYHNQRGVVRARVPLVKTLASAITLGTGGSAGVEGPIAHVGAGIGSLCSRLLGLSAHERRILMVAGLAAGVGAVFRSPMAAALFAAEVLYREMDMEFEVILPGVITSIVAYSVYTMVFGTNNLLDTPEFAFDDPRQLLPYTLLTLVVAMGAKLYVKVFKQTQRLFHRIPLHPGLKPALGGLGVGAFAFFCPQAMGSSYSLVQDAMLGNLPLTLLLFVAAGKIVSTSLTVGSGQSGGTFGPAAVIGGLLGGAVGRFCSLYLPSLSPPDGAFVVVGMAGFFAAAANTPMSTIIMVSEMTGNYALLVPSMWVCVLAFMLVRRSSLYESQLARRSDSPVHLGEMMGEVLQGLSVMDALKNESHEPTVTVFAETSVTELAQRFAGTHHACFPVVNANGKLLGVIDEDALRQALVTEGIQDFVVAADLIDAAPRLTPDESLHSAMRKMVRSKHDELVVVDPVDPTRLLGTLSRRDLIGAYDGRIQQGLEDQASTTGVFKIPLEGWQRAAGRFRGRSSKPTRTTTPD